MIEYKVYSKNNKESWDYFVDNAKDSTIFHSQRFLGYHIDRKFLNHSLMFYKNNKLISVFTGAEIIGNNSKKILFSHPGASFGGILQKTSSLSDTLEIIDLIENYAIKNNFDQITIIPTPPIYLKNNDNAFLYGLKLKEFAEIERYYSSVIPLEENIDKLLKVIHKNKGRTLGYYDTIIQKNSLKIEWTKNFEAYYPILLENKKMYGVKPTHSLEELIQINKLMPNNIKLLIIKKNNVVIGGNLIFIANSKVAIIFYNMINYEFANLQIAVIQVNESIKWAKKNKFKYIDFGISHETGNDNFLIPKMSLIKFKEEFGAVGSIRIVLNKKILNAK